MDTVQARFAVAMAIAAIAVAGCQNLESTTRPETLSRVTTSADARDEEANVITIDHQVPHISTVAANRGELVHLFVRERVRDDASDKPREAVLMIHGRSVPVLAVAELRHDDYDWALFLARSGNADVFMLDFQGSGRSPRPKMDDPCNAPAAQQGILIPNPLSATCPHSYPFTLNTTASDLDELDAAVDYIRNLRGVDKVHLIAWSGGSFQVGPYAVRHPEKIKSLFFFAAIFNTRFLGPPPNADPTPMTIGTRTALFAGSGAAAGWDAEVNAAVAGGCANPREPGIQDVVWNAIMDNDDLGRTWGPPEGVMRVRSAVNAVRVWNSDVAVQLTLPTLIVRGEFDTGQGAIQHLAELYALIQNENKLRFVVQCAGHFMPWEQQRHVLHQLTKEWIKHGRVGGFTKGEFYVDTDGNIRPL